MNVPPKIKHFLWRACRNAIASKSNIKHHIKKGHGECPIRGEEKESLEYILLFCPFAQVVWKASDFSYCHDRFGFPGFCQWWSKLCFLASKGKFRDSLCLLSFICWHM
ncbi:hypothetical protein GQ457_15G012640 [Hibiscus cannabinus]